MRVLFLTPQLPYPQISGGVIKSFKLIEYISSLHELTLCCFLKNNDQKNNVAVFKRLMPHINVFSQYLSIARNPTNLVRSYMACIPLTIYRNQSPSFNQRIVESADSYDAIFVDHYLMFQYVPASYSGRVIIHQHNAEFIMWSGFARLVCNPLKKILLNIEAYRIRNYEVTMCEQANVVLAAPNDRNKMIEAGVRANKFIDTYHLGDEDNLNLPSIKFETTEISVLFIGTLTWEANADGLLWFLSKSWPLIRKCVPSVTFTIVGTCPVALKKKLLQLEPEAQLLGFVADLEPLYRSHRVFVAPLRFGSGIKVKVVNGLYRGIPIVTTEEGATGLNVRDGEHLYIENDAVNFSNSVVRLLREKSIWRKFSHASRDLMRKSYTWDVVLNNVKKSLDGNY